MAFRLSKVMVLALAWPSVVLAADNYKIDTVHSSLTFRIKHMNVANFYGRFNHVSGSFTLDAADATKNAFDVTVKADSVDTANDKRNQHLKSPDFFSVKEFPNITFKSKSAKKTGEKDVEVTGDLTLHGVTKPVTVKVTHTGTAPGRDGGQVAGVEAVLTIKRTDFGMSYGLEGLGDEVQITVSLEGGKQ